MDTRNAYDTDSELAQLRGISWVFFTAAILFFAAIFNPVIFGYFDAASESDRLRLVEENLTAVRLIFVGMGLTELALGVALWLWGKQVADHTPGQRGSVARAFAVVGLVAGAAVMLGRFSSWFADAQELASNDQPVFLRLLWSTSWIGLSLSIIVFGYLMVRGAMPTWLGVTWIVSGLLFWVGILPFWFFFASLLFGIRGIVNFRPGRATAEQISGIQPA